MGITGIWPWVQAGAAPIPMNRTPIGAAMAFTSARCWRSSASVSWIDRKGAPDTFDADGFVALLRRLREGTDRTVYAPVFRREIEEPVANALPVDPRVPVVIVEGNYLLLEDGAWGEVRGLLDEAWHVAVDPAVRVPQLIARHVAFGRSPEAAHAWVMRSDEANARRVEAVAHRADRVIRR